MDISAPSFVAIDFETCQKRRASPIQVGVVRVIDGVIGKAFVEPVMPPAGFDTFDPELTRIHKLTPDYIRGALEWPGILPRIDRFTIAPDGSRLPLVAHNAAFERSVITQTTEQYEGITTVPFEYYCTVLLARRVDPTGPNGPANHKLNTLAVRYGLDQLHHHDAGDDALVGARLMLHLLSLPGAAAALPAARR